VRLIWIVEPTTKTVTVYRSHQDVKVFTTDQEIEEDDVIPGFRIKVAEIFAI
jgi:Uma2 family endonuclease